LVATPQASSVHVNLGAVGQPKPGTLTRLQADRLDAINTFEAPSQVAPKTEPFTPAGNAFELSLPANSFTVLRFGLAR
jgi:alpha-N-arabinofuranosidase